MSLDTGHAPQKKGAVTRSKSFTLIELFVMIAVIATLAGILFSVFAQARENARRAPRISNLKQIGLGVMQYTQDYDEWRQPGANHRGRQRRLRLARRNAQGVMSAFSRQDD